MSLGHKSETLSTKIETNSNDKNPNDTNLSSKHLKLTAMKFKSKNVTESVLSTFPAYLFYVLRI
jgi:hypothetical protein